MFVVCITPAFVIYNSIMVNFWYNNLVLLLVAISSIISFETINFILIRIVVSLSTGQKLLKLLSNLDIREELYTLVFGTTVMTVVAIDKQLFFLLIALFFVITIDRIFSMQRYQEAEKIRSDQLDIFGNPLFILEGIFEKMSMMINKSTIETSELEENINAAKRQVNRIKELLEHIKRLEKDR